MSCAHQREVSENQIFVIKFIRFKIHAFIGIDATNMILKPFLRQIITQFLFEGNLWISGQTRPKSVLVP